MSDDAARLFGLGTAPDTPSPRTAHKPAWTRRLALRIGALAAAVTGVLFLFAMATVPMTPREQAIFAVSTAATFLALNRLPGRRVTLLLVALSLAVSLRYVTWRVTETLWFGSATETLFGVGLALAEIYAVSVLVLGYVQTTWSRDRQVLPLPDDTAQWPDVDVYIPTYNESLTVVRATMLAAMALDWPPQKLHVWLLDDGRREEFRRYALDIGCGYITREDNRHAKAGNLNNAMGATTAPFIAVFDCDHVPTRAFLQLTMGWLVADSSVALVQTPHHFYSPDPFQRNLAAATRVPPEGNMFYGLVQDGNDFWNAAFFCGSCAVLRRAALDEIGGVATDTVTEDAHTMLKLHRRGWSSAYLRLPLAAGLATERLSQHLGQRVRWARGMLQILRIDNPLFGPGLSLAQRACYLQASGHFLFAIPRIVFLTAPLAYLLLGQSVIAASPLAITAYALPHIFHAVATNSRIQRQWRHSFWSEIYETVLALSMVEVTITTLLRPRRGVFNVTAKGELLENDFFDLRAVYPNLILAALLIAGIVRGANELTLGSHPPLVFQAFLLNAIWAFLSLLIVMAALAVGRETRQVRSRTRIAATVPITVSGSDGLMASGQTSDLSQNGASVVLDDAGTLSTDAEVDVTFHLAAGDLSVPAYVMGRDDRGVQLRWEPRTLEEESRVVQAVFGRADAWIGWSAQPLDQPLVSLWRVLMSIRGLFRPRDRPVPEVGTVAAQSSRAVSLAGAILMLASSAVAEPKVAVPAVADNGFTIRPVPQAPGSEPSAGLPADSSPASELTPSKAVPPPPVGSAPASIPRPVPTPQPGSRAGIRTVIYNLRELGARGSLALRGTSELQGVEFGIRADEVVTAAQLDLSGAMSPALLPEFSNITVTLNEQFVGIVPAVREQPNFNLTLPVSPVFFRDNNRLNLRFTGRYTPECNDPLSGLLWATVYDSSTLTLTLERLPPQRDLARLPLPFFDPREKDTLVLPFVLPASPGNDALRAGAILASWFGNQAAFRGIHFPVVDDIPAEGNTVMVVVGSDPRATPGMPQLNGPTLAMIPSPSDPLSSVLVVGGRNGEEAVAAANALAVASRLLGSDFASVQAPQLPERLPYDAPNWIPASRPVRLGELVDASVLQSTGYTGLLHVPFRTAPDFYTWRDRPFAMNIRYRAPPGPVIDVAPSRLDIGLNGFYLGTLSLASIERPDGWIGRVFDWSAARGAQADVAIPVYDVFGFNDLQFYFDIRPMHRGDCVAIPGDLRAAIDPDSTIDLSRGMRFAEMPNLAWFVNSGFPFSRMADLSETAVVLPDRPTPLELSSFLDVMGRIGNLTGYPTTKVAVVRPDGASAVADRDLLILGTIGHLQGANDLMAHGPVRVSGGNLTLSLPGPLESVRRIFGDSRDADRSRATSVLSGGFGEGSAVLIGAQSALTSGRSVVALLAGQATGLSAAVDLLRDTEQAPLIQGDLSLMAGGRVTSYRVAGSYTVGSLPLWLWPSWAMRDQPLALLFWTLFGSTMLGSALFWGMRHRAMRLQVTPPPSRGVREQP